MKNRFAAGLLAFALLALAVLLVISVFHGEHVQPHTPSEYTVQSR